MNQGSHQMREPPSRIIKAYFIILNYVHLLRIRVYLPT